MSLFGELFSLTKTRRFAMLVSSDHDTGVLTISIMPRSVSDRDGAYCKDLTLTATPEEFDTGFIEAIGAYRVKLLPLLEQAQASAVAIDKAAEAAKQPPAAKSAAKSSGAKSAPAKAADRAAARDYRNASSGGEEDDEPNNDWMKNRQPELF